MPITAFVVLYGLYEFCHVPFRLSTDAQVLTRLLDTVLSDILSTNTRFITSMILLYTPSPGRITCVILTRYSGGWEWLSFLGYLVSEDSISVDPNWTKAIREFLQPKDAKGVARFVGMVNHFSKFIPKFSEIAAPLNRLRKNGEKFSWGKEQQGAFIPLKDAISQPPVFRMADFDRTFILPMDASSCALGTVLLQ